MQYLGYPTLKICLTSIRCVPGDLLTYKVVGNFPSSPSYLPHQYSLPFWVYMLLLVVDISCCVIDLLQIYLFINYLLIIIIGKTLICVLRHMRGIFSSIEEEMPTQIKFPTSKKLLKDPLLCA